MVLVALLSARSGLREGSAAEPPSALLDFGGQSLIEYQARLVLASGAEKILIHYDSARAELLTPLMAVADDIGRENGCPIMVVQDMTELARALSPDDRVLLLGEGALVPAEALDALLAVHSGGEAVLTVPSTSTTASFERLDATSMWGGGFCVSGSRVLSTIDMLGEWDLVLTLLRRAVQDGVERVMLSPDLVTQGQLSFLRDQMGADLSLDALSHHAPQDRAMSGGMALLLAPLSRTILREFLHRQVEPARISLISLALAVAGVALVVGGWTLPALLLMLPAFGLATLSEHYAQMTLRATGARWQHRLVQAGGLLLLAVVGVRITQGDPLALMGIAFPLMFIALFTFSQERVAPVTGWQTQLLPGIGGALSLVLLGVVSGLTSWAYALLGLAMAGLVAWRLFRLNEEEL